MGTKIMTRPIIKEHNATTGKIVEREMNDAEFAQYELDQIDSQARVAATEAKATARQEILDRLGLTADEAKILLG
jgi:hypothetical protein